MRIYLRPGDVLPIVDSTNDTLQVSLRNPYGRSIPNAFATSSFRKMVSRLLVIFHHLPEHFLFCPPPPLFPNPDDTFPSHPSPQSPACFAPTWDSSRKDFARHSLAASNCHRPTFRSAFCHPSPASFLSWSLSDRTMVARSTPQSRLDQIPFTK